MFKTLQRLLALLVTDLYFFPISFQNLLPSTNTKMFLALMGLVVFIVNFSTKRTGLADKGFLRLSVIAALVSVISFVSITFNNTYDITYVGYIVSMWVWLGGAYFVVNVINWIEGRVSVKIVANYLIAVCLTQCIIAYTKELYPPLRVWVENTLAGEDYMRGAEERMSGIGAAFDVAGFRFSAVLVIISYFINKMEDDKSTLKYIYYVLSFIIITVIGSMIGRSTVIGTCVGLVYWIFSMRSVDIKINFSMRRTLFFLIIVCVIGVSVYLYNTNPVFYAHVRFGFEGFFSLIEKGKWQTNSTDILFNNMIVFPDNMKTWIIGDGYLNNPFKNTEIAPYYTGPAYYGFYKGTDIGYLRFIFYFGIIGLIMFIYFFVNCFIVLKERLHNHKILFFLILLINFIGWCKVSTDIFPVFAVFLCLMYFEQDDNLCNKTVVE